MTTIANDAVVNVGLSALIFGSAMCYLGAAYVVLVLVGDVLGMKGWPVVTAVAVLFCSYAVVTVIADTTVEVLHSSYKAVFVCFVQVRELLLFVACCCGCCCGCCCCGCEVGEPIDTFRSLWGQRWLAL